MTNVSPLSLPLSPSLIPCLSASLSPSFYASQPHHPTPNLPLAPGLPPVPNLHPLGNDSEKQTHGEWQGKEKG